MAKSLKQLRADLKKLQAKIRKVEKRIDILEEEMNYQYQVLDTLEDLEYGLEDSIWDAKEKKGK